jgi:hypothetical protein
MILCLQCAENVYVEKIISNSVNKKFKTPGIKCECECEYREKSVKCSLSLSLSHFYKWCHQESNRGHMDFQSIALPTELWHLLFGLQIYIANPSKQKLCQKKSVWNHFKMWYICIFTYILQWNSCFIHSITASDLSTTGYQAWLLIADL